MGPIMTLRLGRGTRVIVAVLTVSALAVAIVPWLVLLGWRNEGEPRRRDVALREFPISSSDGWEWTLHTAGTAVPPIGAAHVDSVSVGIRRTTRGWPLASTVEWSIWAGSPCKSSYRQAAEAEAIVRSEIRRGETPAPRQLADQPVTRIYTFCAGVNGAAHLTIQYRLYVLAVVSLVVAAASVREGRRRFRRRAGCCTCCGYSLVGLDGFVCPECGSETHG
jgi:hypothetical protein